MTTEEQIQMIKQWQDELIELAWDEMLKDEEESCTITCGLEQKVFRQTKQI